MNKNYCSLIFAIPLFTISPAYSAKLSNDDIKAVAQFLVSDKMLVKSKKNEDVPLSFYMGTTTDIEKYFGQFICEKDNTCSVEDALYLKPSFAILGVGVNDEGDTLAKRQAQAQIERTDVKYGTNIYDAATWQIALGLAAKNNLIDAQTAKGLIRHELNNITLCESVTPGDGKPCNRATNGFQYGYNKPITDPTDAFTYRMLANLASDNDPFFGFFLKDPFVGTSYESGLTMSYDPAKVNPKYPASYFTNVSTWSDWKPIAGENAWAQMIGPLQASFLTHDGNVLSGSVSLKNAVATLTAFSYMQSGIGAFYYAPGGSLGNTGPIPQGEISLENNFSILGGLQVLNGALNKIVLKTPDQLKAIKLIHTMLYGGTTENGVATIGLLSFFYNGGFDHTNGVFYTSGTAATPTSQSDWTPATGGAMAVDVNTWGIAALGAGTIDNWFGAGTALGIWHNVKQKGGYFNPSGKLMGVGYTLDNASSDKIMSTEWTAGAINTLNMLIKYYSTPNRGATAADLAQLKQDRIDMQAGIENLRNDKYLAANFDSATPSQNFVTLPASEGVGYLYASKRWLIPFGWYANTLPSLTSNAWIVMNQYSFNPFQYSGKLSGKNYPAPAKINISGGGGGPTILPKAVTVSYDAGNLGPIKGLALAYKTDPNAPNWIPAGSVSGRSGSGNLPKGTAIISIAYQADNNSWYGACQVHKAGDICQDSACNSVKVISVAWSQSGTGECNLK